MVDSNFSTKLPPKVIRKIMGSLALRILLVCMILLVIPLLVYSLIIYSREYQFKMRDFFNSMEMMGNSQKHLIDQFIKNETINLNTINVILQQPQFKENSEKNFLFNELSKVQKFSSLFYQESSSSGEWVCTVSNDKQMLNYKNLFKSELERIFDHPSPRVFVSLDPFSNRQQLYLSIPVNKGILTVGFFPESLVENLLDFKNYFHQFDISLIGDDEQIFMSSNPRLSLNEVQLISIKELKDNVSVFNRKFFKKSSSPQYIALKIPLEKTSLALLIDIPEKMIADVEKQEIISKFSILFLVILVLGGGGTVYICRRMAKPLKALCRVMQRVGEGDETARFEKDAMGFEINVLGSDFNRMIQSLFKHMEEAKNERVAREILANELEIGHEIQRSILPRDMPNFPGLDIGAGFFAAKEVAGDFYDLFVKKGEKGEQLLIAIADASGKGISACLYSLCVRSMLRSYEVSFDEVSDIVRFTNDVFCLDTGDTGIFVTAWVGLFDPITSTLHYSNCGHHPAILRRRDGKIEQLSTPGMALGVIPFNKVEASFVKLSPGDLLVLYTDGVLETHQISNGEMFGKERLFKIIDSKSDESAQNIVDSILEEVVSFGFGGSPHDDLTVVAVKVCF